MAGQPEPTPSGDEEMLPYECIFDHTRYLTREKLLEHLKNCPLNPANQEGGEGVDTEHFGSDMGDDYMPALERYDLRRKPPQV
jgi:hypothetical protein